MATQAYRNWVNDGRPWKVAAPVKQFGDRLRGYGYTVYYLGSDDASHLQANTPEDHCPFSFTGWPITHPYPYVTALDVMPPPAGSGLPSLQQLGARIVADRNAGVAGTEWLKYMNWEPDGDWTGRCWKDSWRPNYSRTTSSDRGHIHASGRSDKVTDPGPAYDPVARIRGTATPQEDDMPLSNEDVMKIWTWDLVDGPGVGQAYQLLNKLAADVAAIKETQTAPTAVAVDAAEVAAALAADDTFLAAVAKAVNDDAHARTAE